MSGAQCAFRELENVLMKDVGDHIRDSGKWPLLIDRMGNVATFLRYRDVNYLCALNSGDLQADRIRMAILGGLRFGKPVVFDMMDSDMFSFISDSVNSVQPNLMNLLMSKEITKEENYRKLIASSDSEEYAVHNFADNVIERFMVIFVTTMENPPDELRKMTYNITVVP